MSEFSVMNRPTGKLNRPAKSKNKKIKNLYKKEAKNAVGKISIDRIEYVWV